MDQTVCFSDLTMKHIQHHLMIINFLNLPKRIYLWSIFFIFFRDLKKNWISKNGDPSSSPSGYISDVRSLGKEVFSWQMNYPSHPTHIPSEERFKVAMLSAHRTGELHKVAEKLATEVLAGGTFFSWEFFSEFLEDFWDDSWVIVCNM